MTRLWGTDSRGKVITPGRRNTGEATFAVAGVVPAASLKVRPKLEDLVLVCT